MYKTSLDWYLANIGHPLMTKEQEVNASVNELVVHNLRLVVYVAKKYAKTPEQLADLIQEGNVGLVAAANKFQPDNEKGARFATFAAGYIRGYIINSFSDAFGSKLRGRKYNGQVSLFVDLGLQESRAMDRASVYDFNFDLIDKQHTLEKLRQYLTDKEVEALESKLLDDDIKETAKLMGVSRQRVEQHNSAITEKLKMYRGENNE